MTDNLPRTPNRALLRIVVLLGTAASAVCLLALVRFFPVPEHTNFWDSVFDTGHILIFGLLAISFLVGFAVLLERRCLTAQYLVTAIIALAIGVGVEYWQQFNNRSSELIDVINDLIGICAFSMLFAMFDWRLAAPRRGWQRPSVLFLLSMSLIGLGMVPFIRMASLYRERRVAMPAVVKFKDSWDEIFFYNNSGSFKQTPPPADWPVDRMDKLVETSVGEFSFFPSTRYAGIVVHEPYPDWTGYEVLEIDLYYHAKDPRRWILRIHDRFHENDPRDRFRRPIELEPGFQTIHVPLAEIERAPMMRNMHMKHIAALSLYTIELDEPEVIAIGSLRLSK